MSAVNGESSTVKPAAPEPERGSNGLGGIGFQPQVKMTVQPPRKEDLQRSYATLVGDDSNPKGWYGGMSTSPPDATATTRLGPR